MLKIVLFVLASILILLLVYLINKAKSLHTNVKFLQENLDHSRTKLVEYESQTDDLNYELTQLRVQLSSAKTELNKFQKYQDICDIEQYIISRTLQAENFVEVTKLDASIMIDDIKAYIEEVKAFIDQHQKKALLNIETQAKAQLKGYFKQAEEQNHLNEVVYALENKIAGYPSLLNYSAYDLIEQLVEDFSEHDAARQLKDVQHRIQSAQEQNQVARCNYVDDSRRNTTIELISMAFNSKADLYRSQIQANNISELTQALHDDYVLINYRGLDLSQASINESYLELRLEELKFTAILKALQKQTQHLNESVSI